MPPAEHPGDMAHNASGNQSGDSAQTWDSVNSGQSDDIESSLTGQGTSDREMVAETLRTEPRDEADEAGELEEDEDSDEELDEEE